MGNFLLNRSFPFCAQHFLFMLHRHIHTSPFQNKKKITDNSVFKVAYCWNPFCFHKEAVTVFTGTIPYFRHLPALQDNFSCRCLRLQDTMHEGSSVIGDYWCRRKTLCVMLADGWKSWVLSAPFETTSSRPFFGGLWSNVMRWFFLKQFHRA